MSNQNKNMKSEIQMPQALALSLFGICALSLPAYAQSSGSTPGLSLGNILYGAPGTSTLMSPLVPGASFSLPGIPATPGAPPPLGAGMVPLPITPGMITGPSLIPWANGTAGNAQSLPTNQVVAPSNQIDLPNNQISLPVSNFVAMPPGAMNAAVRGVIPHAPSTPGADPGMLRPPSFNNGSSTASNGQSQESAGVLTNVDQNGQLPNLLSGERSNERNARQGIADYGIKRTTFGFHAQFDNSGGQSVFQGWEPKPGSSTFNSGLGVRALMANPGQLGSKLPPQISFDSPRAATYPGQANSGSTGNHKGNFASAQVTNDLYGVPMINPNKITTTTSGTVQAGPPPAPLTTIANY